MRRWAIALGAIVVLLAGAGIVGLPLVEKHIAAEMRTRIEQRGIAKVGAIEVSVLQRRIVLTDVAITPPPGGVPAATLKVARVDAGGLGWPIDDLIAGRTPFTGWRWGDPVSADRIELSDIYVLDPAAKLEWRMEKIVVEDLDLPRHEPAAELLPGSLAQEARALAVLRLRRFEQRGLVFGSVGNAGTRVALASLVIEDLNKGRIGSVKFLGSDVRNAGAARPELTIADMSVGGIDLRTPLASLQAASWQPGMPIGRIWADRASFSGFGGEVLARIGLSFDRILMEATREGDSIARGRTRVEGLVLRPTGSGREGMQVRIALVSLAVREVAAEIDCSGVEDRTKGELEIDNCAFKSPGLADAAFGAKLVGADEIFWRALDSGDATAMIGTKAALGSVKVVVRDDTLRDRLLKIYADSTTQGVASARAQVALEVRRFQPTGVLITDELTKLLDTVARFVERGGTLTVAAKPEPPLTVDRIGYLTSPGPDLVDVLGLSATLEK